MSDLTNGKKELKDKQGYTDIMRQANKAYARLIQDPQAWKEELEERALWDVTLQDGLKDAE